MLDVGLAKLTDLAPYIKGEKFLDNTKKFEPINKEYFQLFIDKLTQYDIAQAVFEKVEYYKDFYKYCPDFEKWIPKQQKEIFYAVKCGYILEDTPMTLVYQIKKALSEYPAPNMVPLRLGTTVLTPCFKKGYFGNKATLYDVICNVQGSAYTVFDSEHYIDELTNFTEIYIASEDMVALVPNGLAHGLDEAFVRKLTLGPNGLIHSETHLALATMNGYKGVCNSYYDLRELI